MSKEYPTHTELRMRSETIGEKVIFIKWKTTGDIQPAVARHVTGSCLPFPLPKHRYTDYRFLDSDYDIQYLDKKRHEIVSIYEAAEYFAKHPDQKIYV